MGTTAAPYSLPYPVAGDQPNGPAQILALANRIQAVLAQQDTGWVALTLHSGMTGSAYYKQAGNTVTVEWKANKATATNPAADVWICSVPTALAPGVSLWGVAALNLNSNITYSVGTDGSVHLLSMYNTVAFNTYGVCTWVITRPAIP